jgi:WD40 repeat protein
LAYSPDGRRLASASQDQVTVWDAATGKECFTLQGYTGGKWGVFALAYSPDGSRLVSGSWNSLKVWDAATGQECFTFKNSRRADALAYSPDGRLLASGGWENPVSIWNAATGQELLTFRGHTGRVLGVAYSPDGRRLASASGDHTVKVWDATTGHEFLTLKGHTKEVVGIAYSPDGRCLASASLDGTVKIWDATAITPQQLVEREARGLVQSLITKPLSLDKRSAAICRDPTITEAVRQQALIWLEPTWRNHVRRLVEPLFAKPLLRADSPRSVPMPASTNWNGERP